jgi:hypothetical protein
MAVVDPTFRHVHAAEITGKLPAIDRVAGWRVLGVPVVAGRAVQGFRQLR